MRRCGSDGLVTPRARARLWGGIAVTLATAIVASLETGHGADAAPASWTVYHGSQRGTGVVASVRSVDTARRAWTSPELDGQIFGEPLVARDEVIVATEHDTVYALSAATGEVRWSRHLARPVPSSDLPCGNIGPVVGVTGTPVIDPLRREIFVVADELLAGRVEHRLVGLEETTGATRLNESVDPPGADPAALLQRTGLTLDDGRVVFGFGGNYGDCGSYRGRVVAVPETGGAPRFFTVDARPGEREGAVWMGGAAPVVDARGNIFVSVGNGSVTSTQGPYDDSDAVLKLSPTLHLEQYFAPTTWPQDNADDADLSMAPVLLSGGRVLVSGKSRVAYLLSSAHLGGVGGQLASLASACGDDVDGGSAVVGGTVYLPCLTGPVAIRVSASPPSLTRLWSATSGGGPPIVVGGLVWSIGADGSLDAFDVATGALRQRAIIGAPANHFPTPGFGDGLLLCSSATRVVAFRAVPAS